MKLALIGVGRWGTNIKKTLEGMGVEVEAFDKNPPQPSFIKEGAIRHSPLDKGELEGISGVLIATPGSTHAEIALPFIKRGLPVFIEKPMATSLKDALKLQKAAQKSGALVFVGHLHLYNPAFLKARELAKKMGKIRYVAFEGMNWGPFREDMSAWWDWAPHDIAMALELFGKPTSIQAWGEFDWAEAKLTFNTPDVSRRDSSGVAKRGSFSALIHITTLSSEKRKRMLVVGEKYSVVFDDVMPKKKISLISPDRTVSYPAYAKDMPLAAEMKVFLEMIKTGKQPKTDIQNGVDVVKVLDAGERSMKLEGTKVRL